MHLHACQCGIRAHVPIRQCAKGVPNMPKACQFSNLACQRAKKRANFPTSPVKRRTNFSTIFQNNFSVMLNICKFKGYLSNSRKFISQNK